MDDSSSWHSELVLELVVDAAILLPVGLYLTLPVDFYPALPKELCLPPHVELYCTHLVYLYATLPV